ncbi:unnamed protein product [Miscanthus lutarioriparius]|uniref:Uncharacterized protein n=1 Tax=Miscanthus lutarioriparius TaxID=422564 RepID=A0A811P785_9POAL|nr:unnamed protein product [Miscanthus lutarioriparius]
MEEVMRFSRAWGVRALTAFVFSHEPREPEPAQGKEFGYVPTCNRRLLETAGFRSLQKTAREAEATRNRSQLDLTLAIRQAEGHSAIMPEPRS